MPGQGRSTELQPLPILRVSAAHLTQAGESPGVLLEAAAAQVRTLGHTAHPEGHFQRQDRVTQRWLIQTS